MGLFEAIVFLVSFTNTYTYVNKKGWIQKKVQY